MDIRLDKLEETGMAPAEDVNNQSVSEAVESNTNRACAVKNEDSSKNRKGKRARVRLGLGDII
jgi:hypothetical protein